MTPERIRKEINRCLRGYRNEMVQFTQKLCSFPTENPPGRDYKPFTDFLADVVQSIGFPTQIFQVPSEYQQKYTSPVCWDYPRYNIVSRWDVGAPKTLHFNSHYDVVPVASDWKSDPFAPVLKGGRLYGRGTSDMKGCLVACVYAMKAIRQCGLQPPWNLELSFTADEEIGGQCGVGYLVKEKLVHPDAAIVCEGGANDSIMSGHRGVLWLDIHIKGVSGHGSNPGAGINAFEKGIALIERFRDYHEKCAKQQTHHVMDQLFAQRPTMMIGGVSGGGNKVNTIPGDFHFTIDRRLIPEERVKQIKHEFQEIIQTAMREDKQLKAKMNVLMDFDAANTDHNASLCKTAQNAIEKIMKKRGKLRVFGAFTDLHFFVNIARCPAIGYGIEGDGIHGSNEYLSVRSLFDTSRVYAEIALTIH